MTDLYVLPAPDVSLQINEESVELILDPGPEVTLQIEMAGAQGPPGPAGASFQYVHNQAVPATIWVINHNLDGYPNVTTIDSAGDEHVGDVQYLSTNTIRVIFSAGQGGYAYLS